MIEDYDPAKAIYTVFFAIENGKAVNSAMERNIGWVSAMNR